MKKLLITGSNGLLGSNLVRYFSQRSDYKVFSTSQRPSVNPPSQNFIQADLTDNNSVFKTFSKFHPDIVINTVSLVNVDECEEKPQLANKLTIKTAEKVAKVASHFKCRIVYISTDQLFDGKKPIYTEEDSPRPINVYGKTKRIAELETIRNAHKSIIIRTNFFGWSPVGHSITFGEWIYTNIKEKKPMNLFTDYYFTPIEITYFAEAIETVISSSFYGGIINIAGSQRCSKYDFGMCLGTILSKAGICEFDPTLITPTTLDSATFKARRPQDLSLSTAKFRKLFNKELPTLQESVERFCKTIPENKQ